MSSWVTRLGVCLLVLAVSGCASTRNPQDPLERYNRAMFDLNDTVDRVALKPTAEIYRAMTPQFVQTGFGNFFGNLSDVPTLANNLLQGKISASITDFMRISVNTTLGLGGLLDIASEAGLPKHREDFGQTLGKWGVPSGPYVVLPIFGPSTLRDSLATSVDLKADIWTYAPSVKVRNTGTILRLVDQRAALLDATTLIEEAALDRYEFVRDAYLQRRENLVYDGDIPLKKKYDPEAKNLQQEPVLEELVSKEQPLSSSMEVPANTSDPVLAPVATVPASTRAP